SVQVIEKKLNVNRVRHDAWMNRQWQFLIFPETSGRFAIPAVSTSILTPAGARQSLRCEAQTLTVLAASPNEPPPRLASRRPPLTARALMLWAAAVVLTCAIIALAVARTQRSRRVRTRVRRLVKPTVPETRAAVDDYLGTLGIEPTALMHEPSDRGDAYRSLRSLLDALERDRIFAGEQEIADRVRDLVTP
ncbi:MAG TPA: hypothetical protein VII12_19375, partial [Thermoanaerobaculia bacterium]